MKWATQHPTTFIRKADYEVDEPEEDVLDWLFRSHHNLWGNTTEQGYDVSKVCRKTIYDPCPPGWRVAPQDTWTAFAKNGTGGSSQQNVYPDTFSAGYSFYYDANDASSGKTAFFPAAGLRNYNSGELASTRSNGYYWSSSPNYGGNNNAGNLNFNSGNVNPLNNNNRANGFSVRCVQGK